MKGFSHILPGSVKFCRSGEGNEPQHICVTVIKSGIKVWGIIKTLFAILTFLSFSRGEMRRNKALEVTEGNRGQDNDWSLGE